MVLKRLFFHVSLFSTPCRAWATVAATLVGLAVCAPTLPLASDWLVARGLLHAAIVVFFLAPTAYILCYFVTEVRVLRLRAYLILLFAVLTAAVMTLPDRATQEHIHVLVYALIAVTLYKTLAFYLDGLAGYVAPLVLAVLVGLGDEAWQGTVPGRMFDFRDVSDNAVGALLGITFVFIRNRYGISTGSK